MLIYGGSANRISTALQVEIDLAQQLLNNYFNMFPELKTYIQNISTLAKYQGWIQCPVTNRRYFINESNSKGFEDDSTVARRSCNIIIQGASSTMLKRALRYVDENFEELNKKYSKHLTLSQQGRVVAAIHDSSICCRD